MSRVLQRIAFVRPSVFAIVLFCIRSLGPSPVNAQGNAVGAERLVIAVQPYESADSISVAAAGAIVPDGMKSPRRAFLYSFLGTAIPVGVGGGMALGQNELSAGAIVAIGGAVVGPSLGHFYAERDGRAIRGIVIRGTAAGILASADYESSETGNIVLVVGGSVLGIVFLVADIAGASHSAKVHNDAVAGRVRLGVAPLGRAGARASGVTICLTF